MSVAPDYIAPLVGWRTWIVAETNGELRLRSVVFETFWIPGRELRAECRAALSGPLWRWWRRSDRHIAPAPSCGCGIYAASTVDGAAAYLDDYDRLQWRVLHRVIGCVSLWGNLVECEHGWRASHAYPARLYVPAFAARRSRTPTEIAVALADYGVPVEILDCSRASDVLAALAA